MTSRMIPVALLGGCLALAGCATTGELDGLRAQIKDVRGVAEKAAADAAAARNSADHAVATANSAMVTANEAKQQSDATAAKIDRMFKKAMYK